MKTLVLRTVFDRGRTTEGTLRHNPGRMKTVSPWSSLLGELTQPASSPVARNLIVNNSIDFAAVDEHLSGIELLLKDLRKRIAEVSEAVRIAAEQQPNGNGAHAGASPNRRKKG